VRKTHFALAFITAVLCASSVAQSPGLDEMKAKAEKMQEKDRARIYSEIARDLVELAHTQYDAGETEKAEMSVKDAVAYAEKSGAAAQEEHKKIKDAEINLRKAEHRLDEIRHSLPLEDQPTVKTAQDRLAQIRKDLLNAMFAREKK
jgi:hypothetical protein